MGGGILNKNAFTLIELLAIIVILAIIAVITVPIILNIIENSKKGAATDSAYGYKDAVNKYYINELSKPENQGLLLNGQYNVSTGGVLNGSGITNKEIPVSGDKPSAGELHYSNNELKGGCLVIGDYAVIFEGGNVTSTTKGDCDDYTFASEESNGGSSSNNGGNEQQTSIPTIDSCPGCKFIYPSISYAILGSDAADIFSRNMPAPADLTDDYRTLQKDVDIWIAANNIEYYDSSECYDANNETECEQGTTSVQRPYFLGLIPSQTDSTKIGRAFACGIEKDSNDNDVPFCLEGYDPSKWTAEYNVGVLNTIGCEADASNSDAYQCTGSSVYVNVPDTATFEVGYANDYGYCSVDSSGVLGCGD